MLYAGRLILAHNRTLYPFHKWLMHALEAVDDKPADLIKHMHTLLKDPTPENADTLFEAVAYTQLRDHDTVLDLVCRLRLQTKKTY